MQYDDNRAERAALEKRLADLREPTRIVTVRMPKSLHDALKAEAHERSTSLNQLCIRKLISDLPPAEASDASE
jgi:predicted HicB family RNase H-like nuclease